MKALLLILILWLPVTSYAEIPCDGHTQNYPTTDPHFGSPWNVRTSVFRPATNEKVPAVFILPPIDGANELDKSLAVALCASGVASYIVNVINDPPEEERAWDLNSHTWEIQRVQRGIDLVIQDLSSDPALSGRFGLMGASLGGIQTAFIAGSDSRISASVIIAGAGNVPGILARSNQETIKKLRTRRGELYGFANQDVYERMMKNFIVYDPNRVAKNIKPASSFLFITKRDDEVPTQYQEELRSLISSPMVIEIDAGHVEGIAQAGTLHGQEIVQFFQEKLK